MCLGLIENELTISVVVVVRVAVVVFLQTAHVLGRLVAQVTLVCILVVVKALAPSILATFRLAVGEAAAEFFFVVSGDGSIGCLREVALICCK